LNISWHWQSSHCDKLILQSLHFIRFQKSFYIQLDLTFKSNCKHIEIKLQSLIWPWNSHFKLKLDFNLLEYKKLFLKSDSYFLLWFFKGFKNWHRHKYLLNLKLSWNPRFCNIINTQFRKVLFSFLHSGMCFGQYHFNYTKIESPTGVGVSQSLSITVTMLHLVIFVSGAIIIWSSFAHLVRFTHKTFGWIVENTKTILRQKRVTNNQKPNQQNGEIIEEPLCRKIVNIVFNL